MRILGVDLGSRRTGLALSDPHGLTCSPLCVIEERNEGLLLHKIMEIAEEQSVASIVVGIPRPLSGGMNPQMRSVLGFVETLREKAAVPVTTWDERFTSKLAEAGGSGKFPRDAVAACYMLQSYLDFQAGSGRNQ